MNSTIALKSNATNGITVFDLLLFIIIPVLFAVSCYWVQTIWVLFALPALFLYQKNRFRAVVFILIFYLSLNFEEIYDIKQFFHSTMSLGLAVWVFTALIFSIPWVLFYKKNCSALNAFIRTPIFLIILLLPPIGIFVWMNPLIIAGSLYPGFGWLGVFITFFLISISAAWVFSYRSRVIFLVILFLFVVSIFSNIIYQKPNINKRWVAINTHFGGAPKAIFDQTMREQRLIRFVHAALKNKKTFVVLPENMTWWFPGDQVQWSQTISMLQKNHAYVMIGRDRYNIDKSQDSGVEILGGKKPIFIPEHIPMPFGEWIPFSNPVGHFNLHFRAGSVYRVGHLKIMFLVCYEQLIPYLFLKGFLCNTKPDVVVNIANQWFAMRSGYLKQKMNMLLFSRLFHIPVLISTNYKT